VQITTRNSWLAEETYQQVSDVRSLMTDDGNPGALTLKNSPAIQFFGQVGITEAPLNTYAVGFIQYITMYKFQVEYEDTLLEYAPLLPLSDGGVSGPQPGLYNQPGYIQDAGFPWYRPPLAVDDHAGNYQNKWHHYGTSVNDGPGFRFAWRLDPVGKRNHLRSVMRFHRFETWFVLWDLHLKRVEAAFFRWRWEHALSVTCDHAQLTGHSKRVLVHECSNKLIERTTAPTDAIPALALTGPSANDIAPRCQIKKQKPTLAPISLKPVKK
jgi:hypothetical protein